MMWCLHGNLQLPSAWNQFDNTWRIKDADGSTIPVSLYCPRLWDSSIDGFESWTGAFCQQVEDQSASNPRWLMGYSLGGRLALHAALTRPDLWRGVIVIGAHPGYVSEQERRQQIDWDEAWALRFLDEQNAWDDLLADWDALPLFEGRSNPVIRPESAFSRTRIAACFRNFSKGRQHYLTPSLAKRSTPPLLFLSGGSDNKYTEIGRQLATACTAMQHTVIPRAGHRAPWENPLAFSRIIQVFLDATS